MIRISYKSLPEIHDYSCTLDTYNGPIRAKKAKQQIDKVSWLQCVVVHVLHKPSSILKSCYHSVPTTIHLPFPHSSLLRNMISFRIHIIPLVRNLFIGRHESCNVDDPEGVGGEGSRFIKWKAVSEIFSFYFFSSNFSFSSPSGSLQILLTVLNHQFSRNIFVNF